MRNRAFAKAARAESLRRLEQAARDVDDFNGLVLMYDKLDGNRERKERYWEAMSYNDFRDDRRICDETVIPPPLLHPWWRQLLRGDFLDTIHDCPQEIYEFVSSPAVSDQLRGLDENRKEVLYYRAVRGWSPQKLAVFREQTDRNIRKVYDATIRKVRKWLYERLKPRYEKDLPLTREQQKFCADYETGAFEKENGDESD